MFARSGFFSFDLPGSFSLLLTGFQHRSDVPSGHGFQAGISVP
jgi:hypothetical protein